LRKIYFKILKLIDLLFSECYYSDANNLPIKFYFRKKRKNLEEYKMKKETMALIERYIEDFGHFTDGQGNFKNIIAAAAKESFDAVVNLRNAFIEAGVSVDTFDSQLLGALIKYNEIETIMKR
jgi:hypothetical protein